MKSEISISNYPSHTLAIKCSSGNLSDSAFNTKIPPEPESKIPMPGRRNSFNMKCISVTFIPNRTNAKARKYTP